MLAQQPMVDQSGRCRPACKQAKALQLSSSRLVGFAVCYVTITLDGAFMAGILYFEIQ